MSAGKKIAIIGKSHVAAIKMASKAVSADYPDCELTFFAAPGPLFRKLELDPINRVFGAIHGSSLTKKKRELLCKLNNTDQINLDGFDAIVLAGIDVKENLNAQVLRRFSIDGTNHSKPGRRLSMSAYRAMLAEMMADALPLPGWRNWQGSHIFATPAPRVAENCVEVDNTIIEPPINVRSWVPLVERRLTQPEIFSNYIETLREGFAAAGITFVPNPDETYGESGLTKAEYACGAVNFRTIRNTGMDFDSKHMNADFGAICLRNLLDVIQAKLPSVSLRQAGKDAARLDVK